MNEFLKLKLVNSLEKVFPEIEPAEKAAMLQLTSLQDETVSFQVAYYYQENLRQYVKIEVHSPIKDKIRVREVLLVPSNYPCHPETDENYLKTIPGLYPDLLREISDLRCKLVRGQWRSFWIDVEVTEEIKEGIYPIEISISSENENIKASIKTQIEVIGASLPPLPIRHTEWFHGDCIADFYGVEVFSDEHWRYLDHFIQVAAKRDCNMILTPIFTPPLDTAKGGERTTIQLIDIKVTNGRYEFDFTNLKRWIELCKKNGMVYFEMSHLFTQWGAIAAPKIMAVKDGTYQQIFGWNTPAAGGEYEEFLKKFLPELTQKLKEWKIADHTYFHISDEPLKEQLNSYQKAVKVVEPYLKDFEIIDALSDYEFYEQGLVKQPVCSINHIQEFIDHNVENLWSYYCTAQYLNVSNRFMAMPSARNRIYGVQVYKYGMKGILHWGYNFYNSEYSIKRINPYETTDCDCAFPSGDAFLVYPGKDGIPEESVRLLVHYQAMTDIRALTLLESKKGKEYVIQIMEEELEEPITFTQYPYSDNYCISLRNRINYEIKKISNEVGL